ncbi:PulJ/GspJ family protein [Pelagicoccus albus]|uniref:Prepilin-type N-terminal cleavage/methylation domain-containing protein n=1 Tax=Pelagicoccus albus TaxID=415222 RepID=A0A7X1B6Q3_9BACT|nr:prepilin-type N-terminal cleavage/methylation domain-containing protein [Pelagicoccus albus]MBC2605385.1 prepilin-type N-terminal cleavage/methylation domain-containing protein [Pelagicoccus albus]
MNRASKQAGFTLFELIVSLAITSVIALFVFSFATNLAKLWRHTEGSVGTELDTQIALDTIAGDLESAFFAERGVPMFAVSSISKTGGDLYNYDFSGRWVNVSAEGAGRPAEVHFDPENHHYGWAGSWLRFFTASPTFNAVGYQIIRRPAFSDSNVSSYLLHRSLIRMDRTLEGGFDISLGEYAIGTTSSALESPRLDAVILEDVIDFGVRLYVFEDSFPGNEDSPRGLRLIFPANGSGVLSDSYREHLASTAYGNDYSIRYPDVIEVFVRVLDDVGADLLRQSEDGEGLLTYEEIVEDHARVYSRMIRRRGKGVGG